MRKVSGIYKITNSVTTDFYIGSSIDVKKRWANHKSPSMRKKYPSSKLYNDIAHYGLANFIFEVIEETDNLKEREQYWMNKLHPTYNKARSYGLDTERLRALINRFNRSNISHATVEAKKYLIVQE